MQMPATPARSYSATVRTTLTALPYPLSASAMTGIETAASMWRATSRFSVMVSRFTSGMARWAADTVKLDDHTTGKPAASMSLADSASWAPTIGTRPGRRSRARSIAAFGMGIPPGWPRRREPAASRLGLRLFGAGDYWVLALPRRWESSSNDAPSSCCLAFIRLTRSAYDDVWMILLNWVR